MFISNDKETQYVSDIGGAVLLTMPGFHKASIEEAKQCVKAYVDAGDEKAWEAVKELRAMTDDSLSTYSRVMPVPNPKADGPRISELMRSLCSHNID